MPDRRIPFEAQSVQMPRCDDCATRTNNSRRAHALRLPEQRLLAIILIRKTKERGIESPWWKATMTARAEWLADRIA